jgi:hypothetical protein
MIVAFPESWMVNRLLELPKLHPDRQEAKRQTYGALYGASAQRLSAGGFMGLEVILVDGHWRRRSWIERLFGRPWHPWQVQAWVEPIVPSGETYIVGGTMYCRPATYKALLAEIGTRRALESTA